MVEASKRWQQGLDEVVVVAMEAVAVVGLLQTRATLISTPLLEL
jgi:hypothetical protein